ncbi:MAG: serine protease [Clostridia bacterium]|nr:serine protease [Clostridia bacterium]
MNENGNNIIPNDEPMKENVPTPPVQNSFPENKNPGANGAYASYTPPRAGFTEPRTSYVPPKAEPDTNAPDSKKKNKKKKSKTIGSVGFIIFIVLLVVALLGAGAFSVYWIITHPSDGKDQSLSGGDGTQIVLTESPTPSENSESLTTIQIAENAEKINVGIMIYGKTQSFISGTSSSLVGEGSGIVMAVDKTNTYTYILTCAHVISDAASNGYTITVQDADGNTYDGIMVGCDAKTDIGVIKIAATGLPVAQFGDSSALKKGQKVYAIGNPGGMEFFGSFTDGMVSSIDRPISSESGYEMKCIQHTTPINSGNSGGALLNEFGQVIGINSSKIVSTGYEGMAFAIPISDAKPIIDDIIANGYVTNRPKLGISYTSAMQYQQYAMIIKLKELPAGSLIIRDISPDSSLAGTNVEIYDLIIAVDGEDLDTADVLLDKIENGKVGDELTLTICRISDDYSISKFDVTVKLVEDTGTSSSSSQTEQPDNYWEHYFGN